MKFNSVIMSLVLISNAYSFASLDRENLTTYQIEQVLAYQKKQKDYKIRKKLHKRNMANNDKNIGLVYGGSVITGYLTILFTNAVALDFISNYFDKFKYLNPAYEAWYSRIKPDHILYELFPDLNALKKVDPEPVKYLYKDGKEDLKFFAQIIACIACCKISYEVFKYTKAKLEEKLIVPISIEDEVEFEG